MKGVKFSWSWLAAAEVHVWLYFRHESLYVELLYIDSADDPPPAFAIAWKFSCGLIRGDVNLSLLAYIRYMKSVNLVFSDD